MSDLVRNTGGTIAARGDTKLIRDGLAARIPSEALSTVADAGEHSERLADKIHEEVDEIVASDYRDPAEYADALEGLMALAGIAGVAWDEVERVRLAKKAERGGFERGLVYDPALDPTRP